MDSDAQENKTRGSCLFGKSLQAQRRRITNLEIHPPLYNHHQGHSWRFQSVDGETNYHWTDETEHSQQQSHEGCGRYKYDECSQPGRSGPREHHSRAFERLERPLLAEAQF